MDKGQDCNIILSQRQTSFDALDSESGYAGVSAILPSETVAHMSLAFKIRYTTIARFF